MTRSLAPIIAAALTIAGCAGAEEEPPAPVSERQARLASSLGQLNCEDWEKADPTLRADIVVELQAFAASQVTGEGVEGTGPVLENEQATELFETRCGPRFARGFLLYKLYFHAVALAGAPSAPMD